MPLMKRRLVSAVTCVVMLITSVMCFCSPSRAAVVSSAHLRGAANHSCCHCADEVRCSRGQTNECPNAGHRCAHCQGTLFSENAPTTNIARELRAFPQAIDFITSSEPAPVRLERIRMDFRDHFALAGVHPTLFSLHCALTL